MQQVFLDVDTQIDFLYPTGALCVPGSVEILPQLAALTQYALAQGIPLVSTADAHLEDDPEFQSYPAHCVAGSFGAAKVPETLSPKAIRIRPEEMAPDSWQGQLILEKRSVDMFTQPSIAALLESLNPERFVVYGVVTEICVLHAVKGLLRLGKPVTVVSDAIYSLQSSKAQELLNSWKAAGCAIRKTAEIVG
jgi:nicotinamidase/pyrazinamidase